MFSNLLAQAEQRSDFVQLINSLDSDVVGAAIILTIIGVFGSVIAITVTLIESRKKIKLATIQKEMVDDLVNRGFSVDEVQKLVYGESGWNKFCSIFKGEKQQPATTQQYSQTQYRPAPPVKQGV